MWPAFFQHKKMELIGFLHLLRGKLTGNDQEQINGANQALNALDEEREVYLKEKRAAIRRVNPDWPEKKKTDFVPQGREERESNNRDISGY
jgi:uncharacterized protein YjbJ (UPF0337 family)